MSLPRLPLRPPQHGLTLLLLHLLLLHSILDHRLPTQGPAVLQTEMVHPTYGMFPCGYTCRKVLCFRTLSPLCSKMVRPLLVDPRRV